MKTTRISSIEFIRLYVALIVMVIHITEFFFSDTVSLTGTAVCLVEFFFMLSGFFLMSHLDGKQDGEETVWDFIIGKVRRFIVPLTIMNIIQFVLKCIVDGANTAGGVLKKLLHFGWEFLVLQCAGMIQSPQFNQDYLIGPSWYLSAMLLALVFAYPLAKHYRRFFVNIICPFSVLAVYSVFAQKYGTLNVGNDFSGPFMDAFLRGFAGTCAGVLCYGAYNYCLKKGGEPSGFMKAAEILCWLVLPGAPLLAYFCSEDFGFLLLIPLFAVILSAMLNKTPAARLFNSIPPRTASFLGRISLYIYLSHFTALFIAMMLLPDNQAAAKVACTVAVTAVLSTMLYLVDSARSARKKKVRTQ